MFNTVNSDTSSDNLSQKFRGSSFCILAVDDNPVEFELLKDAFEICGMTVVLLTAITAPMALAALEVARVERQPDLALVDINMPMVSGFELAAVLIEQGVPTILMSTQVDDHRAIQAIRMGVLELLEKPSKHAGYVVLAERVIRILCESQTAKNAITNTRI